jgi:hypothetical protein
MQTVNFTRLTTIVILGLFLGGFVFFGAGPSLLAHGHDAIANGIYILSKVILISGASFFATTWAQASRFQAWGLGVFIEMIDHFVFRFISYAQIQLGSNQPIFGTDFGGLFYSLFFSYMLFFPIVIALAFIGGELARFSSKDSASRSV